ncbi:hypothetical protein [Flavobacterium sp. ASV13]|uniref:hypothetical protein n=1 Tax=Flavobacterium sp. ASV13 TaxID=1506583 RepID=UPI000558D023|nr:hypothetical protein [Flavobacterium sp. ASV13]
MADITESEIRVFIAENLPDASEIPAEDHRAVENKIIDFLIQEVGKTAKSKVLLLESFVLDRNFTVDTGFTVGTEITSVVAMLVCKTSNNGFFPNDVVTAPTPYPQDSGRTAAQGIGVQYTNVSPDSIKVMVNDQLTIMTAYNATVNAPANNVLISGVDAAKWSIKLIVGYK